MLRALTAIFLAIGLLFVAWSLLVMTGGRDWLAATMVTEKAPEKVAATEETPAEAPAKPDQAKAEEAKPAEPVEAKPTEAKPDSAEAENEAAEKTAAPESAAAPAETADEGAAGAAEEPAEAADNEGGGTDVDPAGNPAETAKNAEKGSLKSPYQDSYDEVAEEGHKKFMAAGCNGCHGGTGGGGMGPPLSNPVWVYGNDGDTLFRLIALGSDGLQAQGYTRKGSENVVGPMPPHGGIVKSNDDMWKIIGWIWSINPPDKSASAAE